MQRTTDKLIHEECGAHALRSAAHLSFQVKPVSNKGVIVFHLGACVGVLFRGNSCTKFCDYAIVHIVHVYSFRGSVGAIVPLKVWLMIFPK